MCDFSTPSSSSLPFIYKGIHYYLHTRRRSYKPGETPPPQIAPEIIFMRLRWPSAHCRRDEAEPKFLSGFCPGQCGEAVGYGTSSRHCHGLHISPHVRLLLLKLLASAFNSSRLVSHPLDHFQGLVLPSCFTLYGVLG